MRPASLRRRQGHPRCSRHTRRSGESKRAHKLIRAVPHHHALCRAGRQSLRCLRCCWAADCKSAPATRRQHERGGCSLLAVPTQICTLLPPKTYRYILEEHLQCLFERRCLSQQVATAVPAGRARVGGLWAAAGGRGQRQYQRLPGNCAGCSKCGIRIARAARPGAGLHSWVSCMCTHGASRAAWQEPTMLTITSRMPHVFRAMVGVGSVADRVLASVRLPIE